MDIPAFLTAAEAYPPPANADGTQMRFSYGTAGFRTVGTTLRSTVFRCGALAAIRSRVTGRACGIVITASHNPEADNGVKLVDCTGGMLPTTWEADAEALANAPDAEAMRAAGGDPRNDEHACQQKKLKRVRKRYAKARKPRADRHFRLFAGA